MSVLASMRKKAAAWLDPGRGGAGGARGWRPADAVGYKAGEVSRFDADFTPSMMGPNVSADQNLRMVRNRSRSMTETGETLEGIRRTLGTKVVGGSGINFEPDTGIEALDEQLDAIQARYCEYVDADRRMTPAALQRLVLSEMVTVGDCGVHLVVAPAWRGYAQGPAVEMIDEARIPLELNGRTKDGNRVRQGVEFDALGRVVAFHVLKEHPADGIFSFFTASIGGVGMERVPAADMHLAHVARRIGEVRGVPWAMPIMQMVRREGLLTDAILIAFDNLACAAPIVKGWSPPRDGGTPSDGMVDQNGNPFLESAPGRWAFIPSTADVVMPQTVLPQGLQDFQAAMARSYSRAMDMPYETLAKDLRGSSFSSARSAKMEERPGVRALQNHLFDVTMRAYWRRVVEWAILKGEVDLARLDAESRALLAANPNLVYGVSVMFPGEDWIDPRSEAMAEQVALATGVRTLREIGGQRGFDWKDQITQRAEEEAYEKAERERLGLPPKAAPGNPGAAPAGGDGADAKPGDGTGPGAGGRIAAYLNGSAH